MRIQMGKGRGVSLPWKNVERGIGIDELDETSPLAALGLPIKVILVGRDRESSRKVKKDWYSCLGLLDNQEDMAIETSKPQKV